MSKICKSVSKEEQDHILEAAKQYNNRNKISGVLLCSSGFFFQILEGEETIVKDLFYNKILKDSRHKDIYTVLQKSTRITFFKGYYSKFNCSDHPDLKICQLKKYIEKHKIQDNPDRFRRLLIPHLATALTNL
ncbi:BLUF domain-containing protein [Aquimarina agarivorans]|uniref:BLUF domain-containing protein n=1 Tax=Aquimarina agarivorans TaxID=980584 RepID=UPI001EE657C1|nr:BLUF domain-containing protein [Aquimarina agarivorans]